LLSQFTSLKRLRTASVEEISAVPGFGPDLARRVLAALAATEEERQPAVNMSTGEIVG
jgi:excinuclease ABC subunit C